jgi:3-phosphoglycerate kinase/fructose/tagatose bisphosphate aldolase
MMNEMKIDSQLASIYKLYMAIARGEVGGFTVPAFNLRGMTEELTAGILAAAQETKTGAFILEIARSESGYTGQAPYEFVQRVLTGVKRVGWDGPLFIQGDHDQLKVAEPGQIARGEIARMEEFIEEEIAAGFYNLDIDASTLVDTNLARIEDQQKVNGEVTAELAKYIRNHQPEGIQISIGGEIGHIGDRNSRAEDLDQFVKIFRSQYPADLVGLSKISVQTGTSHGGRMDADGTLATMPVDFEVIESLSKMARGVGMAGVVQHGASTLPESMYGEFPRRGAVEIHLATGWQNMIMDHPDLPPELMKEIKSWLDITYGAERKDSENDRQFYYRTRKKSWKQFRPEFDALSPEFKQTIQEEMKERCIRLFRELKVSGTRELVEKYVSTSVNQRISESASQNIGEDRMNTVEEAEVKGKTVVVRVDWNVTLGKALQIVDDTRIVRTLPTIRSIINRGAKQVILLAHLGKAEERRSLAPVAKYASELVGEEIHLFNDYTNKPLDHLVMLENLRFWPGEETNDPEFARELASLGDIYVNEAFGESHREAASIVGITKYLPSYGGLWMVEEVETISRVMNNPERPYVVVMGGAKVEDKIKLLETLSTKADVILLGGKLANEFLQQKRKLTGKAKIVTPVEGDKLLDIGPKTIQIFKKEIAKAKTVVWNGPMGKVEEPQYRAGTEAIFAAIAGNTKGYTLVGGGDTLAALHNEELLGKIDHVSTGGGAMLKLIEEGKLVGVEALTR